MEPSIPTPNELRKYLLGLLSEEDRLAIEDRYFADPELLDRIDAAERELIQAYLADRLPAEERRAFESHFIRSSAARRKLEEARVVIEYFRRPGRRSWKAIAAALLVMSGAATYLALELRRSRLEGQNKSESRVDTVAGVARHRLTPGRQRSATDPDQVLRLTSSVALLQLTLEVDRECLLGQCRAVLTIAGRRSPITVPLLGQADQPHVEIPASYFPPRADCLLEIWAGDRKIESFQMSIEKTSP